MPVELKGPDCSGGSHDGPTGSRGRPGARLTRFERKVDSLPLVRSTQYRARPGDGLHSIMICANKEMLHTYDWAKQRFGLSDDFAGRVLHFLDRFRRDGTDSR